MKIKDRLKEPSSYAGLGLLVQGLLMLLGRPEVADAANVIPQVAEKVATNDYAGAALVALGGLAFIIKENK